MTSSHFPWSFRAAQSSFGVHWGQRKASEDSTSLFPNGLLAPAPARLDFYGL